MKNTSSYQVSPHVIRIDSLDSESDSDLDDISPAYKTPPSNIELHPSVILPCTLPSPLPPELLSRLGVGGGGVGMGIRDGGESERGLILYKPLKYGIEDDEERGEGARAVELIRRRELKEEDLELARERAEVAKDNGAEMDVEVGIGLGIVDHQGATSDTVGGSVDGEMMDLDD